ncbi:MAG: ABC transporter ATP-binding protein [Megasphaera massiliensis]|uniref:ABC transporter ATP-binding protein n=1 Tax=Megasphaera massiliensis TaxID=1232428 RepID=UPI00210A6807|nr:ABC transporter ATP-binding protein [Megasphaera massiliensis]MCQ5210504.1 ABC transporter ATP-binding protein/permease [Megasphaera massiliensis]MEE0658565.1 ABC transporter ATP-binding protein [Megasphaera massiliensis]
MILVKRFLRDSRSQWWRLAVLTLALILAASFEIISPRLLGNIVDAIVHGIEEQQEITAILDGTTNTVLLLVFFYSCHAVFTYASEFIIAGASQHMVLALRSRVSHQLHHLPMAYFNQHNRGDMLSRLTSDLDSVGETLREGIPGLISSFIGIVGAVAMMIWISPRLAAIILSVIVVGVLGLTFTAKKARTIYLRKQEALGAVNGGIEELISGKQIVQAFGLEKITTDNLSDLNTRLFTRERQSGFMGQLIMPLVNFINQIGYVLIAIQGGLLVLRGQITLGDIQAFFLYVTQVSDPISRSSYILTRFQETHAALGRIYEILDYPMEDDSGTIEVLPDEKTGRQEPSYDEARRQPATASKDNAIEFKHVTFGYSADKPLMEDVNFEIPKGHVVAIVGPTGAGKTTIINLLMRFYEISGGAITIHGTDIRDLRRETLHRQIGMVLQDTWIFTGTIAENIAYGKPDASREEIIKVAKLAMADHFIRTLPLGYDTVLKNGADDLSQGQRQLLTIARAFLVNPSILVLDEATANVDTRTEVEVQKAMNQLLKGRTGIVIAHRLSTIRDADFLLVVNQGRIVEQGPHGELLARGGYYKELYENYAKGMSV